MDRFSWSMSWERRKLEPIDTPPEPEPPTCDMCDDADAVLEAPEKCKVRFCRKCEQQAREQFELNDEDMSYI